MYYKVLGKDGRSCHGGSAQWSLPTDDGPGEWMPEIVDIKPCASGYHVCTMEQLLAWLGPAIYEVECGGEHAACDDKHVFGRARLLRRLDAWNERTARLFACDCAEHVLHIYESQVPGDARPRRAIEVARLYADGRATNNEIAAARAAAWDAAWSAARDAARAAARAGAQAGAWSAARDAAWDAAWSAARAAARDDARTWQADRLGAVLYGEAQ